MGKLYIQASVGINNYAMDQGDELVSKDNLSHEPDI